MPDALMWTVSFIPIAKLKDNRVMISRAACVRVCVWFSIIIYSWFVCDDHCECKLRMRCVHLFPLSKYWGCEAKSLRMNLAISSGVRAWVWERDGSSISDNIGIDAYEINTHTISISNRSSAGQICAPHMLQSINNMPQIDHKGCCYETRSEKNPKLYKMVSWQTNTSDSLCSSLLFCSIEFSKLDEWGAIWCKVRSMTTTTTSTMMMMMMSTVRIRNVCMCKRTTEWKQHLMAHLMITYYVNALHCISLCCEVVNCMENDILFNTKHTCTHKPHQLIGTLFTTWPNENWYTQY